MNFPEHYRDKKAEDSQTIFKRYNVSLDILERKTTELADQSSLWYIQAKK